MALLFCDSFDHYASADILKKWTSIDNQASISANGRLSTNCFQTIGGGGGLHVGSIKKELGVTASTLIAGFAFKPVTRYTNGAIIMFYDSSTAQCCVTFENSSYLLHCRLGNLSTGTLLGSSTKSLVFNSWSYIEVLTTIHNTAGVMRVRVNGEPWINLSGLNNRSSANNYSTAIALGDYEHTGGYEQTQYYDDFYVCDTAGSYNNDFLGDVTVKSLYPSAAGSWNQFSGGATFGSSASNATFATASNRTYVNMNNVAPITSPITRLQVYIAGAGDFYFATFYAAGGNTLSTRDYIVASGLNIGLNDLTGLNMLCNAGDYIGAYSSAGTIDDHSDGANKYKTGLYIPCTASDFGGTTYNPNLAITVYQADVGGSSNNYMSVDEASMNNDTDYVLTSGMLYKDSYNYQNPSDTTLNIKGIQVCTTARKDAAYNRSLQPFTIRDGIEYPASSVALSTSYVINRDIYETDPSTLTPWTVSGLSVAEFGILTSI